MRLDLALDALEQAVDDCETGAAIVYRRDHVVQYAPIRYTNRFAEACREAPIAS